MALQNGTHAPDFDLVNQFGEQVRLSDYRGKCAVVLVFFPLAFSGICTGELCELSENLAEFRQRGVQLMGISVDSKHALRAWGEQEGYQFNLLSDFWPHGAVARSYEALLERRGFANRATYLIDSTGVIRANFVTSQGEPRPFAAYQGALADLGLGDDESDSL